ncbi:hypothetical protein [Streptomyces sp. NPDC048187]|uniref:hypothetical protein n=1 Tax=Streptomyces sp. NPDC048187 TaxID=3365509 RepID=UPI0037225CB0
MRHEHIAGRDFHVRLPRGTDTVRVEATGTPTERVPVLSEANPPGDAVTVGPDEGAPGKTVLAELGLA